jgi:hypothetical protein
MDTGREPDDPDRHSIPGFIYARFPGRGPNPLIKLFRDRTEAALKTGYELIKWLWRFNNRNRQAFVEFKTFEFDDGRGYLDLTDYGVESRDAVNERCGNGLSKVQKMVDEAFDKVDPKDWGSPAAYGTAIHAALDRIIKASKDGDKQEFRAEISFGKPSGEDASEIGEGIRWGTKDSVRVDVIQDLGDGKVCVYDLKTGGAKLTQLRASDLAGMIYMARERGQSKNEENPSSKPKDTPRMRAKSIIVTEVRPTPKPEEQ